MVAGWLKVTFIASTFVVGALSSAHADSSFLQVDESLLASAQPLSSQPSARPLQVYQLESQAVDRRFTCSAPSLNLRIVIEIAHTNDQAHTAVMQLINPLGAVESSFLTTASRLPRYPEVHLDSYKIRYGDDLSTLVINAHRSTTKNQPSLVSGMLQTAGSQKVELLNCRDEFLHPESLKALDAPFDANFKDARIAQNNLPKSVCLIRAFTQDMKDTFICSAVLVDKRLALTANHCLEKMKGHMAELDCPGQAPAAIDIAGSIINPNHDREPWRVAEDIAVLKLKSDMNTPPAQLVATSSEGADFLFTQSESCGLYGYGTNFDGKMGELHGVKFTPPPEDLGGLNLSVENYQTEKLITSDPRFFLRPGDSGGGVICRRGSDEFVVGIHSFSYPIDSTVNSASVGHNYDWIIQQINKFNGVTSTETVSTQADDPNLKAATAAASDNQ